MNVGGAPGPGGGGTWDEPKPTGGVGSSGETKRAGGAESGANVGRLQRGGRDEPESGGGGEPEPGGGGEPMPGVGGDERIGSNLGWRRHGDEGGGGTMVCGRRDDGREDGGVEERIRRGGVDGGGCRQISPSSRSSSFTFPFSDEARHV